jgi:outer membrane autotransporter protein
VFAALAGTYGWGSASTTVTPIGLTDTAASRFDPSATGVSGEVGERFGLHGWALTPSLGGAWSHIDSGAFTETGSALDLTGSSHAYDRYKGWLGLEAESTVDTGGGALTLRAYGRAVALGGDDVIRLPVTFVGSTTMLDIDGANTGSFGGDLGASLAYHFGHGVQAFAAYDARLRERYVSQTGSAGLKISF